MSEYTHVWFLSSLVVIHFTVICATDAQICEQNNKHINCPRRNEPAHFTFCCVQENSTEAYCCKNPMDNKNEELMKLVSITVIVCCIITSILMVVCCFWSQCPLFDSCWVNYSERGVIAYTKEEEALNQPPDENQHVHHYTPVNVKISRVDDV